MKRLATLIASAFFIACSSDDGGSSNDGQVNSADDVLGLWRVTAIYEHGSTVNTATPCNIQISSVFFGENHLFTKRTGNTTDDGTCSTTTSSYDEYYILQGIVRIEQNSTNKRIYSAEIIAGDLHLTETSYTNSGGFHSIAEEDQETLIYEKDNN